MCEVKDIVFEGGKTVYVSELKNVMFGVCRFEMALHEIMDLRERLKGKELEPENIVPLLRARIAEQDWFLDEANGVIHAAGEYIKKLEGKDNFLTKRQRKPKKRSRRK